MLPRYSNVLKGVLSRGSYDSNYLLSELGLFNMWSPFAWGWGDVNARNQ